MKTKGLQGLVDGNNGFAGCALTFEILRFTQNDMDR
jgi:hypothetical protein